jgi:hypothetical protein
MAPPAGRLAGQTMVVPVMIRPQRTAHHFSFLNRGLVPIAPLLGSPLCALCALWVGGWVGSRPARGNEPLGELRMRREQKTKGGFHF